MPAAIILGVAAYTGVTAVVGGAIGLAITGAAVSATAATAIGTAVIAGGVTAAQGGKASDVLRSAVLGGITAGVGASISASIASDVAFNAIASGAPGQLAVVMGNALGGAAAGAITSGASALLSGQDPVEALIRGGLTAGLSAGVNSAVYEVTKDIPLLSNPSNKVESAFQRATKTAIATGILGGSPSDAFTQSVITSFGAMGFDYIKSAIKDYSDQLRNSATDVETAGNAVNSNIQQQNQTVTNYQNLANQFNSLYDQIAPAQADYEAALQTTQLWSQQNGLVPSQVFYHYLNQYKAASDAKLATLNQTIETYNNFYNNNIGTLNGYVSTLDTLKAQYPELLNTYTGEEAEFKTALEEFQVQEAKNATLALKGLEDTAVAKRIFVEQEGREPTDAELAQYATNGDLVGNVDRAKTTRPEAVAFWKQTFGTEPTEFDLLGIEGLAESDAQTTVSNIYSDRSTTDSDELDKFLQDIGKGQVTLTPEEQRDLLGKSEAEVRNAIAGKYNAWIDDFNTVTGEEAQQRWAAAGNTRPMTAEDMIQMVAGNQAAAENYAQRVADYEQVVYNGSQYATREQAQQAAKEEGGYQQYSYNGRVYPTDQEVPYNPYADNVTNQSEAMLNAIRAGKTSYEWGDKVYKVNNNYTDAIRQINDQPTWALAQAKAQELLGPGAPFSYRDQGSFVTSVSVNDVVKQVAPNMINPEEVPQVFDASNYTDRLQAARAAAALSKDHFTFSDGKTYQISSDFRDWLTKTQIAEKELAELGSPFNGTKYSTKAQAAIAANADGAKVFTFSDGKTYRVPDNMAQLMMPNETFAEMERLIEQNTTLVNAEKLRAAADFNDSVLGKLFPTGPERELAAQFMAGSGEALRGVIGTINGLRHAVDDAMWSAMPAEWKKAYEYGIIISPTDTPRERLAKLEQVKQLEAEGVQPKTLSGGLSIDKDSAIYKFSKKLIDTGALNSPEVQKQQQQITEFLKDVPAYEKPAALMAIVNNGNWLGALGYLSNEIPQELPGLLAGGIFAKAGKLGVGALTSATIDAVIDGGQAYINRYEQAIKRGASEAQARFEGYTFAAVQGLSELVPGYIADKTLLKVITKEADDLIMSGLITHGKQTGAALLTAYGSGAVSGFTTSAFEDWYDTGRIDYDKAWTQATIEGFVEKAMAGGAIAASDTAQVIGRMKDGTVATVQDLLNKNKNIDYTSIDRTAPVFNFNGNTLSLDQIQTASDRAITDPVFDIQNYTTVLRDLGDAGFVDAIAPDVAMQVSLAPDANTLNTQLQEIGLTPAEALTAADIKFDNQVTTQKEVENAFDRYSYFNPDAQAIESFVGVKGDANLNKAVEDYIAPRYTTPDEARAFFESVGYRPSEQEIAQFAGQVPDATQSTAISTYAAQNTLDIAEVKAAAALEGITLTDEQARQYVRQAPENQAAAELRQQLDPTKTTTEEAVQFLRDSGFTEEQARAAAAQFVGPAEATAQQQVAAYTDPRQVTFAEAKKFLTDLGYTPTDEEVNQFVQQSADPITQAIQQQVGTYVDPRQVTVQEVKNAAAAAGIPLTDEEAAAYAGQKSQEATLGTLVADITRDFKLATTQDIKEAIAGIDFPEGLTAEDVTKVITDYMEANPGLSAEDVGKQVADELAKLPDFATPEDVNAAISNALFNYATRTEIQTIEKNILAEVTKNEKAGMARDAALQKAINTVANQQKTSTTALTNKISSVQTALGKEIDTLQKDLAQTEKDILAEVEKNEKAGLTRDQALQKAIKDVAASQKTSDAIILEKLNTTQSNLNTKITDLQKDLAQTEKDILAEVAKNEAAGLTRDQALQKAIKDVAASQKTSTTALTNKISGIETALGKEIETQVKALETKFSTEIQKAIDSGLKGDEALQKAIDSVATELGASKEDLLDQIGKSETQLRADFATQLAGVTTELGNVETRLTAAIDAAKAAGLQGDAALDAAIKSVAADLGTSKEDLLSQIGKTEQALRTDFATQLAGVTTELGNVETRLTTAIEAAKAAGLQGDAALQAGLDAVAADLGVTRQNLLTQLGTTEAALRAEIEASQTALGQQITTGLEGIRTDLANAEARINERAAQYEALGLSRDQALSTAISDVAAQLGTTAANLTSQIDAAKTALGTQITGVKTDLQQQIDQAAQLLGKPAQAVTQQDIDFVNSVIQQTPTTYTPEQLAYDINQDQKIDQQDIDILTRLMTPTTGEPPEIPAGTRWAPTGLFGEIAGLRTDLVGQLQQMEQRRQQEAAAAEAARQAEAAAAAERAKQAEANARARAEQQRLSQARQQLFGMVQQPGALGRRVDVKTPDVVKLGPLYTGLYDPSQGLFRSPEQQQFFQAPFGTYFDGGEVTEEELLQIVRG